MKILKQTTIVLELLDNTVSKINFFGCSPFENGMDALWSPGSYAHWVPYLQFQNSALDYTIYRNNPSSDIRTVDLDTTPTHETVLQNSVFEIDSALSDTMNMVFTYSYHTRQYEDYADYDHSVSVVPFQLGPIKANVFYDPTIGNMGRGEKTFSSDQAVDRSSNDSEWAQTELRFSSDYDGAFNFTLGFFNIETQSATNYGIAAPYLAVLEQRISWTKCHILSCKCRLWWSTLLGDLLWRIASG